MVIISLQPKRGSLMSEPKEAGEDDKYEYYVIHDGLEISHFLRRPKGVHPSIRCENCD